MLRTTRNIGADPHAEAGPAAAQVGPDGTLYVAGASAVLALDPRTLEVERHLPVPAVPRGLGISADGQHLYLSLSDRVAALDAASGAELRSIALPGAAGIAHVATPDLH
jgi:DNA-binding beta-propeller fold protein YncE